MTLRVIGELDSVQRIIFKNCLSYFTKDVAQQVLAPFLDPDKYDDYEISSVSGRNMYYVVTSYAKRTMLHVGSGENEVTTCVYENYKRICDIYGRSNFDPFNRADSPKLSVLIDGFEYDSSLGQIYFLKWASQTGLLDWCSANISMILKDTEQTMRTHRENKAMEYAVTGKKRRRSLTNFTPSTVMAVTVVGSSYDPYRSETL